MGIIVKIKKNPERPNDSDTLSMKLPVKPPRRFAKKLDNSQNPNIKPISLTGANLLTYDKPTGETHNSPSV